LGREGDEDSDEEAAEIVDAYLAVRKLRDSRGHFDSDVA